MPHKRKGKFYRDTFVCPKCGADNEIYRYASSEGLKTQSYCRSCCKYVSVIAGPNNDKP